MFSVRRRVLGVLAAEVSFERGCWMSMTMLAYDTWTRCRVSMRAVRGGGCWAASDHRLCLARLQLAAIAALLLADHN